MDLIERLSRMIELFPAGASVILPVDSLREWLEQPAGDVFLPDLRLEEVAELMHRKEGTVRMWCRTGKLAAYKLHGREWRVTRAALSSFQTDQAETARDPQPIDIGAWRKVV